MTLVAAFVLSVVALFTFAGTQLVQGVGRSAWSSRVDQAALYRPERRATISDQDGYAHRTADNTASTRRDRGREQWQGTTANPYSFRGWLSDTFGTNKLTAFSSSPVRNVSAETNFSPKIKDPNLRLEPQLPDGRRPASQRPTEAAQTLVRVPPPVPEPPKLEIPAPAPLYQYQVETLPRMEGDRARLHPMSAGRKIHNAIQSEPTLSEATKLTIRASLKDNRVILRGLVLNEASKKRVGDIAREIAGEQIPIDNGLIALIPNSQVESETH